MTVTVTTKYVFKDMPATGLTGIGGEGGGERDEHDVGAQFRGQLGDGVADALGQIETCRQALGRSNDPVVGIQQHRVREGAPGIDT